MTSLPSRMKCTLLAAFVSLFAAATAAAQTNPASCTNDIECVATPQCGGDVCDWNGTPAQRCRPAGTSPKGMDGWCTADTDCKCMAMGATCDTSTLRCTFTRPCDGPDGGSCTTGSGGSSGTAGSGGGGGGGGGCNLASTAPAGASALLVGLGLIVLARRRRR
ncbi:MAG TPA: hypothetical protein VIF57_25740 [Polyangia bacterium]|jgi:MYXO-CTERM domain-containing protein